MEKDIEAEAKRDDEERIPHKEGYEGLENPEEHGGIDVVAVEERVPSNHEKKFKPGNEKHNSRRSPHIIVREIGALRKENTSNEDDLEELQPVFQALKVFDRCCDQLSGFSSNQKTPEHDEKNFEGSNVEDIRGEEKNKDDGEQNVQIVEF